MGRILKQKALAGLEEVETGFPGLWSRGGKLVRLENEYA
jgi:hypothetical protein